MSGRPSGTVWCMHLVCEHALVSLTHRQGCCYWVSKSGRPSGTIWCMSLVCEHALVSLTVRQCCCWSVRALPFACACTCMQHVSPANGKGKGAFLSVVHPCLPVSADILLTPKWISAAAKKPLHYITSNTGAFHYESRLSYLGRRMTRVVADSFGFDPPLPSWACY